MAYFGQTNKAAIYKFIITSIYVKKMQPLLKHLGALINMYTDIFQISCLIASYIETFLFLMYFCFLGNFSYPNKKKWYK